MSWQAIGFLVAAAFVAIGGFLVWKGRRGAGEARALKRLAEQRRKEIQRRMGEIAEDYQKAVDAALNPAESILEDYRKALVDLVNHDDEEVFQKAVEAYTSTAQERLRVLKEELEEAKKRTGTGRTPGAEL